jgi:imidazole glycerol-phosphate synthase subunit HisF
MLKPRIIFTLLYQDGNFMLSRNFRLQRVGDIKWLEKNYDFSQIAFSIDELIILDVSRGEKDKDKFSEHVKELNKICFVPIAAGGGVNSIDDALQLFKSGADKIVINSSLYNKSNFTEEIIKNFGKQSLIASIDVIQNKKNYDVMIDNGTNKINIDLSSWLERVIAMSVGEIYLNSIDKDGTGQGYLFDLLEFLPNEIPLPIIMAGGAGNEKHLIEGLKHPKIDAVATAHLFNFIGSGLRLARESIIDDGFNLPKWDVDLARRLNKK